MLFRHAFLAICARRVSILAVFIATIAASGGASAGSYSVLYSFCPKQNCPDGQDAANPLIMDGKGNLYGTTEFGGAHQAGTVYMIPAGGGSETVLYSFTGGADGYQPISGVIMDGNGNLYGTTKGTGLGTIYQLTPGGRLKVLATAPLSFQAGLVMDGNGNIFGTDTNLNTQNAEVFELTPNGDMTKWSGAVITTLSAKEGQNTSSPLVIDKHGNLFGLAYEGGKQGGGSIFEVSKKLGEWTVKAIYADFCSLHCSNNRGPTGAIAMDGSGNLYGTASGLGTINGAGTIWELSPNANHKKWTFKILHNFSCLATEGCEPFGGITIDRSRTLYGTTQLGGVQGQGTIFSQVPGGAFTTLYGFCPAGTQTGCKDGINPTAALITDGARNFFGTTSENGANALKTGGGGTVFQFTP
jgi:uncharacterized repeat protein (TIGR03803 family)